ncbi:helix-turn-helix transcriptional regulator [Streptomyces platensis]|uniref:helix-turn-helix domain-containing protein n=1 Tax=Streptomyces platensis TaxID=58346 RepID=UPI002E81993B|nr:helix-turn-helix transcriptional regulator [Streptomyces platensis]WTI50534.1 helix-turn-helix transcriptional regulator [Streptomyces platensis]WUB83912.1 helix-turn-helix transcriptional regulator [Streptomyces platensis]
MDASDLHPADGLRAVVAAIDELLRDLDLGRDVIDIDHLSHRTGLPVPRVQALLDDTGEASEQEQDSFQDRLVFLRETRRKPDGKMYTLDEIGAGAGISHGQVGYLLNGKRKSPGLDVTRKLEKFFEVEPGFFTATGRQALYRALQSTHEQLTHLALLRGKGINRLAMRSGTSGDSRIDRELRDALSEVLSRPEGEDPEVRELTDRMRSLPSKSRRRVFPLIQGLLGLARPENEERTSPGRPGG